MEPDPHHFGKLVSVPHQSGKRDQDPHQSEKQVKGPHMSEKVVVLEGHFGALKSSNLEKSEW